MYANMYVMKYVRICCHAGCVVAILSESHHGTHSTVPAWLQHGGLGLVLCVDFSHSSTLGTLENKIWTDCPSSDSDFKGKQYL